MLQPVILSGGAGTRLWPLSRGNFPKQFADLVGGESLFRRTLTRVADPARFAPPLVVCNLEHRFLVAEQLREAGVEPAAILLEPCARNTAPAAALAALVAVETEPDAVIALLPADHLIEEVEAMAALLARAEAAARQGYLVTFGIVPERPETGYGYIRQGAPLPDAPGQAVAAFVEKPDAATAETYLAAGDYLWNSGMFVAGAAQLLAEMRRHCPEVVRAAERALAGAERDLTFSRLDAEAFAAAPSISLDYAVMERTERAAVIPAEVGWQDLGAWPALWTAAEKDAAGNVVRGEAELNDVSGSYLRADDGRLIAAIGLRDMVVVSTQDAVFVAPRARAADVGGLAKTLAADGRPEASDPPVVHRPWGSYQTLVEAPGFKVKRIVVAPGGALSLQYHEQRSEHWVVVSGAAEVTVGDEVCVLAQDQSTYVPQGTRHRLRNRGADPLVMIEVQCGAYLGEDDIVRLADNYGRGA